MGAKRAGTEREKQINLAAARQPPPQTRQGSKPAWAETAKAWFGGAQRNRARPAAGRGGNRKGEAKFAIAQLYDRRREQVTLDEVERILI